MSGSSQIPDDCRCDAAFVDAGCHQLQTPWRLIAFTRSNSRRSHRGFCDRTLHTGIVEGRLEPSEGGDRLFNHRGHLAVVSTLQPIASALWPAAVRAFAAARTDSS